VYSFQDEYGAAVQAEFFSGVKPFACFKIIRRQLNFFTRERERQDIYQSVGVGWGWGPVWGSTVQVAPTATEGILFIDIIDGKQKDLVWQGKGAGILSERANKDEQIDKFVSEILKQYPPKVND